MHQEIGECHDNSDHDYIEELKNLIKGFKQPYDGTTYNSMLQKLDDIEAREAADSMNDIEKEVFSCDLRVARKWIQQKQRKEERAEPKEGRMLELAGDEVLQK